MPQDSTLTDLMYEPRKKSEVRWLWELMDKYDGETCFLLGNGWSITFYDPIKIKEETGATFIGCNRAFQKWPLDYVIWQDSGISDICVKAPCTKIMPHRKLARFKDGGVDYSTTYFYGFGQYKQRFNQSSLELSNSGCLGFQLAHYMGFSTIILLGCDCEFIQEKDLSFRANIFKDKQAVRTNNLAKKAGGARLEEVHRDGRVKYTNKNMLRFAKKFEELYGRFKDDADIYRLGAHGILRVPSMDEYESFWSDKHPGRQQNAEERNGS
jgi:hypothetical protein